MSQNHVIVRLERATKIFPMGQSPVVALDQVDLDVVSGEFTALIGPSGSGKTTLLMLIGCMEQPTRGRVIFEGVDTSCLGMDALAELRRHRIGFVFQYFNLIPVLSVYENVEFPLLLAGQGDRQGRVTQLLEAVGLAERSQQRPAQLSGGEQQRVAIARALATNPRIVLADEPTGNLDSQTANDVLALMAELNRTFGTTFLFATHDPVVIAHARRRIYLRDGRIQRVEEHSAGEV